VSEETPKCWICKEDLTLTETPYYTLWNCEKCINDVSEALKSCKKKIKGVSSE